MSLSSSVFQLLILPIPIHSRHILPLRFTLVVAHASRTILQQLIVCNLKRLGLSVV